MKPGADITQIHMLESTHSFAAYQEELKKNAVKKTGRGGKLEEALLVGGDETEGVASGDKIDAEDGQEDIGI
ncbi:MAG: hypothetical protein UT67_C0001G0044 [Candidatus Magasanikbacteria bacterium GW2011_GWA2_40_10]|uniref:Uncharacterized protein n=1 Tax=Candidatus Magasanikbacteria bacterium GW2011_GWA2_40_10 TaxID=1619037 RepID=A0A0G0Q597_9BACT|nr:MAG: hypothetical protein UT67_C0001G0044 [Candidatus Magasanikbacteria bacterium GW2011_GWA2_40_10]